MVLITETSFSFETDPGNLDQEKHYTIRCNIMHDIFRPRRCFADRIEAAISIRENDWDAHCNANAQSIFFDI